MYCVDWWHNKICQENSVRIRIKTNFIAIESNCRVNIEHVHIFCATVLQQQQTALCSTEVDVRGKWMTWETWPCTRKCPQFCPVAVMYAVSNKTIVLNCFRGGSVLVVVGWLHEQWKDVGNHSILNYLLWSWCFNLQYLMAPSGGERYFATIERCNIFIGCCRVLHDPSCLTPSAFTSCLPFVCQ